MPYMVTWLLCAQSMWEWKLMRKYLLFWIYTISDSNIVHKNQPKSITTVSTSWDRQSEITVMTSLNIIRVMVVAMTEILQNHQNIQQRQTELSSWMNFAHDKIIFSFERILKCFWPRSVCVLCCLHNPHLKSLHLDENSCCHVVVGNMDSHNISQIIVRSSRWWLCHCQLVLPVYSY